MFAIRHWTSRVDEAWKESTVIWLFGVRRVGKTCLCHSVSNVANFNCESPRARRMMEDPDLFLETNTGRILAIDEIHLLDNPSELLKLAADHHPDIKVVATGSSTLSASAKFRDTLTGRKTDIWLTPMPHADLADFGGGRIEDRLRKGGLPGMFLAKAPPDRKYQEWIQDYWSRDIQELFKVEKRNSFMKFTELLLVNSGGMFEATGYAAKCEASRQTISNYLSILESTYAVSLLRPFSTRKTTEIVAAPKVYAFDTGFVRVFNGWDDPRPQELGKLWEHYVLNELHNILRTRDISYWREKSGREIDFIIKKGSSASFAIECKWSSKDFDAKGMLAFHEAYPEARLVLVARNEDKPYRKKFKNADITITGIAHLGEAFQ